MQVGQLGRHPRRRPQLSRGAQLAEGGLPVGASLREVIVGAGKSAQHDVSGRGLARFDGRREHMAGALEIAGRERRTPRGDKLGGRHPGHTAEPR